MTIYLDHNAAAPLAHAASEAIRQTLAIVGNPSSIHSAGRAARRIVEGARTNIAAVTGARREDVVFTGSGSEACQLLLNMPDRPRRLVGATEHAAILDAAPGAEILPVTPQGLLDLDALRAALGDDASDVIVAVMLANNETGAIQPISEIAEIVHAVSGLLMVDAAQAFGKITVSLSDTGADALALSSAKIGGPLGVGAAVFAPGVIPKAILTGGGQERGLRGGSENLIGIAGFGAAAAEIPNALDRQGDIAALRDHMETAIADIAPNVCAASAGAPRLANTSALPMPGMDAATQVMAFDLAGIAISAGAACSSGKVGASHVLAAMGLSDEDAGCIIRISLGAQTTPAEIAAFVKTWETLYKGNNKKSAGTRTE